MGLPDTAHLQVSNLVAAAATEGKKKDTRRQQESTSPRRAAPPVAAGDELALAGATPQPYTCNTAVEDSEAGPCIPRVQAATGDYTPWLGQEFASEHEAYEFYRYYAWKLGFSVRREYANKSRKTGEITSRKFVCSREGFKAPDKRTNHTRTPQPDTRTGCHANLVIRRKNDTSKYEVYAFEAQHNHPLFIPSCANPLQRKLSDVQSSDADNSGSEFKACINDYEEEVELFTAWEAMISKYNLHSNRRKKKGRNAKSQRKSCIEKGLQKTKKVQPEQSPIQYTMLDATQPGNVLFQGLDISNPFPMGQLNYGGVQPQPGLCPSLPTVSRELGFAAYLSQPSSNSQHNQQKSTALLKVIVHICFNLQYNSWDKTGPVEDQINFSNSYQSVIEATKNSHLPGYIHQQHVHAMLRSTTS
uniref:WRKY domain-containing protein n=1 Tax=Oryza nivara TaxID=4536 RepID=A0A0E0HYL3_ORYNI